MGLIDQNAYFDALPATITVSTQVNIRERRPSAPRAKAEADARPAGGAATKLVSDAVESPAQRVRPRF